jgi:membrane protein
MAGILTHPPRTGPSSPPKREQAIRVARAVWAEIQKDDCLGLAAEMAYHLTLSLLPALLFIVSILGLLGGRQDAFADTMGLLGQVVPKEAMPLLRDTLSTIIRGSSGGLATLGLLGALWTASNGAAVVVKGINRAYDMPTHKDPAWLERILAVLMILLVCTGLVVNLNLLLFGDQLIHWIGDLFSLPEFLQIALQGVRWLIIVGGLITVSALAYALAVLSHTPRLTWRDTWPGAIVFVLLWLAVSWAFGYYVENMAHFNQVYGALGAVVILMTWLYLSSLALLIGGEFNAVISSLGRRGDTPTEHPAPEPVAPPRQ